MRANKHIRKELLDTRQVRKYSIFFIGEIIFIIMGIFLALQLDNWNEIRKDKNDALAFLERIEEDLSSDTIQLNRLIDVATEKEIAVKKYFENASKKTYSVNSLLKKIGGIRKKYQKFNPTNDTYEELITSEKVEYISYNTRSALRKLQQRFEYLDRADEGMISEVMYLEVECHKYFDYSYYTRDFAEERNLISKKRKAQGLLVRQNFLTMYSRWMTWQRIQYSKTKSIMRECLAELKKEL